VRSKWNLLGVIKNVHNSDSLMEFGVQPQLKSLYLANNSWLNDESIIMFASIFPSLQLLDLRSCQNISKGVGQVLKSCCKIRNLNLAYCSTVNLLGINFRVPQLEVLNLSYTKVDDGTLYVTSKNCRGLLHLLLENSDVTERGVKHVLENCTQLREINLKGCDKVHASVVDSMVFSRPSLRKIIAPPGFLLSDKKKKLFLRQGCIVCSESTLL